MSEESAKTNGVKEEGPKGSSTTEKALNEVDAGISSTGILNAAPVTNGVSAPPASSDNDSAVSQIADELNSILKNGKRADVIPREVLNQMDESQIDEQRALAKRLLARKDAGVEDVVHDTEKSIEEIRTLDTQLNRLNSCLDKIESDNDSLNSKLQALLDNQVKLRNEKKTSLQHMNEEFRKNSEEVSSQVASILAACRMSRQESTPASNGGSGTAQ